MNKGSKTMDAFEAARQAFFSGKVITTSTATFTQSKSFEGMSTETAKKAGLVDSRKEPAFASR